MSNKINFILPEFYDPENINLKWISLLHQHPEWFRDNLEINTLYGVFPGMIWNGGRVNGRYDEKVSINDCTNMIKDLNDHGISLRFTCTNLLLEEKHLHDYRCNEIMKAANESGMNSILVATDILEDYIRNNYPNIKICASTTQFINDTNKIDELIESDRYDFVIPYYMMIRELDKLESIKNKDRVELMINEKCVHNCPHRKDHYESISKLVLNQGIDTYSMMDKQNQLSLDEVFKMISTGHVPSENDGAFEKVENFVCTNNTRRPFYEYLEEDNCVMKNEVIDKCIDMGYRFFKMAGREISPRTNILEEYIYYMIKPEYRALVQSMVLCDGLGSIPTKLN